MTQEQKTKISEHFDELHAIVSDCGFKPPNDISDALRAAYLAGADYALDIYRPRWISVEDELPPYNKNVLVYDAEHPYFEFWWARRYAKGSGRLLDKNGFTTLTDEVNVTHWMYINPPIPNPNLEDNSKKGGEE